MVREGPDSPKGVNGSLCGVVHKIKPSSDNDT